MSHGCPNFISIPTGLAICSVPRHLVYVGKSGACLGRIESARTTAFMEPTIVTIILGVVAGCCSTGKITVECWLAAAMIPFVTFPILVLCIPLVVMITVVITYIVMVPSTLVAMSFTQ